MISFDSWMKQINVLLSDKYGGLESSDFEDWSWWDAWEDDCTPWQAIHAAERYWNGAY